MKYTPFERVTVGAAVAAILGTFAATAYMPSARAAEAAADEDLAEVTVTGSRILRRDYESNSPLVSVEAEQFENRTGLNIESYLNQLPSFNPAAAPTIQTGEGSNSDVQITAVRSVGIAAVSLRGFGPNRNLVLVDGHRTVPSNALMVTDLNSIPSAMIERAEIISGGASAVYGADAIGGVTNFILKDNFSGLEVDAQYGVTEEGDNKEFRGTALFGTDFSDGRGHITLGAEYYQRGDALEKDHKFFRKAWSDPYTPSNDLFVFGYNGYAATPVFPNAAPTVAPNVNTARTIFSGRPIYPATDPATGLPNPASGVQTGVCSVAGNCNSVGFRFNPDGTIFTTAGNNLYKFKGAVDGQEFATVRQYDTSISTAGQEFNALKWNNQEALVSSPQDRYSIFGRARFDINDHLEFFTNVRWAQTVTETLLLPTNATGGWAAFIPYDPNIDSPVNPALDYTNQTVVASVLANPTAAGNINPTFRATGTAGASHPVPVEMAILLNSRPLAGRTQPWESQTYPLLSFDQRATTNTNTTWSVDTGLHFDLPFGDWTGEAYYSHGESASYAHAFGNNSLSRWRALVTAPDYGRNAVIDGNTGSASPGQGFGSATITCGTGFYDTLFKADVRASADCNFAVEAQLQTQQTNEQDIAELNFQGGLFNLPAGQVRAAAGMEYRANRSAFTPDILQSTASFTDQVIGVYPTSYMDAGTYVMDYYGELLVPVLSDLPFLKKLELELGGRYSDYKDTDSTVTYKINANIEFNDWLRLRGGYNRATRAPNLGELFLSTQEVFTIGGNNFGDPCGVRSNAPYGAGGTSADPIMGPGEAAPVIAKGSTPESRASTRMICEAQMGSAGATQFYTVADAPAGGGAGFNWLLQQGNPDLESEVADTWTAGFVFSSPWTNPLASGLQASIDWWKVDIDDAIQQYSVDYARYRCYGTNIVTTAAEAAAQAATTECGLVGRNTSSGGAQTVLLAYDNQATISTSGIDLAMSWSAALGDMGLESIPGRLGVNVTAGFLDYYKTKQSPTSYDVETDWKGSLGPNLTGTNGGAYDYRLNMGLTYSLPRLSFSLRWRYLPSVLPVAKASENAVIANNKRVAGGGEGIVLSYTPTTVKKVPAYDIFDLSMGWVINDKLSLRAGIDNLFNTSPAITGASSGYPYDPTLTAAQNLTNRQAVCNTEQEALGCTDPAGYSLQNPGYGLTNGGYYDTLGRRAFVGLKMTF